MGDSQEGIAVVTFQNSKFCPVLLKSVIKIWTLIKVPGPIETCVGTKL